MENLDSNEDYINENKNNLYPINKINTNNNNDDLNYSIDFSLLNNSRELKNLFNCYNHLNQSSNYSNKNFLEFLRKANFISSNLNFENSNNNHNNNSQNNLNSISNSSNFSNYQANNNNENHALGFDLLKNFNNKETSDIIINVQGIPFYTHRVNKFYNFTLILF